MLTNWLSDMYQMISDGNISYPFFCMDKNKEDELGKNKAVTPRLAFLFCLKTAEKQGSFEKKKTVLLLFLNYNRVSKNDSRMFLNLKPVLEFVDFWVQVDAN